ncbi:MAG: hypothetical protein WCA20_01110 [Candidatus Sulfotelmatobacter sp.]
MVICSGHFGHLFPAKVGGYDLNVTIFQLAPFDLRRSWLRASVFALFVSASVAQQPAPVAPVAPEPTSTGTEQPLGTVARNSKKQTSVRAKKVITEDDMDALANALPRLRMEGAENADEIIAAIGQYKASHTPEETEAAVQAWYERYDQDLAAAIQQNQVVNSLREENFSNGYELCRESGDYQSCEKRRRAEYVGVRHDQYTISRNIALEVRIQHVFMKVRVGIMRNNLRYDWFKIRTTNGIDIF